MRGLGRYFPATFVLLLFCTGFSDTLLSKDFTYARATVITEKGVTIPVEVSDSPSKRFLGLGNRDSLRAGWGMLFVFTQAVTDLARMPEGRAIDFARAHVE